MLRGSSSIPGKRNNDGTRLRPLARKSCAARNAKELRIATPYMPTHVPFGVSSLFGRSNRGGCDAVLVCNYVRAGARGRSGTLTVIKFIVSGNGSGRGTTTSLAKRLPRVFAAVAGLSFLSYLMSGLVMEMAIGRPSSTAVVGFIFFPIMSLIVAGIGYIVGLVARPFLSRRGERDRVDSSKLRRNSLLTIIVFAILGGIAGAMQMVLVERHNAPRLISNSGAFEVTPYSKEAASAAKTRSTQIWHFTAVETLQTTWLDRQFAAYVDGAVLELKADSTVLASYDFRSYSYITQVDTLPTRSSRGDDFLAVLVTLRASSYRSMLLIYDDDFNLVYEQLLERCGGTGYMAATVDHEGVLVVDLCSPFVIDTNP